jgi:endonuclease YncB( thermonuclease family)
VNVVDGDTIDVARGPDGRDTDTVRLLGMDTPDRGKHHLDSGP